MEQNYKQIFEEKLNKKVRSSSYLEDGFSNDSYLINDSYVIRLAKPNKDETIDYAKEKQVYDIIAPLKISESILEFDNNGTKISKFVHNTRKYVNTPTNEQILYVAKKLKKLHGSNLNVPFGYMMFNKCNIYKKNIDSSLHLSERYEKKITNEVRKIFIKAPLVLCHNDLVKGNLLFKFNDVVFIDWEYASMNNLYFDLASFISENNLSEEQEEFFLQKYFGCKYNNMKKNRVDLFIKFQDILFYYWGHYMYARRGDEIYKIIAEEKLERIKKGMVK